MYNLSQAGIFSDPVETDPPPPPIFHLLHILSCSKVLLARLALISLPCAACLLLSHGRLSTSARTIPVPVDDTWEWKQKWQWGVKSWHSLDLASSWDCSMWPVPPCHLSLPWRALRLSAQLSPCQMTWWRYWHRWTTPIRKSQQQPPKLHHYSCLTWSSTAKPATIETTGSNLHTTEDVARIHATCHGSHCLKTDQDVQNGNVATLTLLFPFSHIPM